jgi:anti-anti-sigma regulatory factor
MKNKTFSIRTSINKASKSLTITFEGDLAIKNAEAIKKTIQTINFSNDPVTIYLKNIEKFDITSVQTIRALRIYLNNKGNITSILSEIPENFERLLKNTGFDKIMLNNT